MTLRAEKPPPSVYPRELKTLGDHLRAKRLDLGLQQKDAAELMGTKECNVWGWENNRVQPAIRFVPRIYEFLGYCLYDPGWGFGESLRKRRAAFGLSRKQFAQKLGMDPTTVQRWETGEGRPTEESRQRLEALFD